MDRRAPPTVSELAHSVTRPPRSLPFCSPISLRSRLTVACVTSQPAAASAATSSCWLLMERSRSMPPDKLLSLPLVHRRSPPDRKAISAFCACRRFSA